MTARFFSLEVADTNPETASAKTVRFHVPEELKGRFQWVAGQHVTLRFELDGKEVRRSYSISAAPGNGVPLQVTVKRVKGGLVSNHINDRVKFGDRIDVMPPFGGFQLAPGKKLRRTHYFFGAGSGITPLFAMLQAVLHNEPHSFVHLVYGNHSQKSIIFRDQLDAMCITRSSQLTVSHVVSSPSLLSWYPYWRRGRIDMAATEQLFAEHPPQAQDVQYYVCGPDDMNKAVRAALMSLDVPHNRIHSESFGGLVDRDDSIGGVAATARIGLDGASHKLRVEQGQTILEASRNAGLSLPFSCESGICGACKAVLEHGQVHMRARAALEDAEIERGAILACQAVPLSAEVALDFSAPE